MYNSPIRIITSDLGMKMAEEFDKQIYQAALNVGINVDKHELLRALQYDRQQYEKGYADGKAESRWIPVTERLPEEWTDVLVLSECGFCEVAVYLGGHLNKWRVTWNHDMLDGDVTHWMPLPEPPKGE